MSPTSASICSRDIFSSACKLMRSSKRWWSSTLRSVCLSRLAKAPASPMVTRRCSSRSFSLSSSRRAAPDAFRICHMLTLQTQGCGDTAVEQLKILCDRALALQFRNRDAPVDSRSNQREIVADGECDVAAQRRPHIGRADRSGQRLVVAIDDDPDLQRTKTLGFQQLKLALRALQSCYSQLSNEQDKVRAGDH